MQPIQKENVVESFTNPKPASGRCNTKPEGGNGPNASWVNAITDSTCTCANPSEKQIKCVTNAGKAVDGACPTGSADTTVYWCKVQHSKTPSR